MTEEQKEKYANFLDKVSEILGLNKPIDVLKLCVITDEYFKPIEKHIAELEKENAELKAEVKNNEDLATVAYMQGAEQQKKKADKQLTKAKEIIEKLLNAFASNDFFEEEELCAMAEAEQFLEESQAGAYGDIPTDEHSGAETVE